MDEGIATRFFFGQEFQLKENQFDENINALYLGIKSDNVEVAHLKDQVSKAGKDLTVQLLCKMLNITYEGAMDLNLSFARKQIYSHHVQKAHELKRAELLALQQKK